MSETLFEVGLRASLQGSLLLLLMLILFHLFGQKLSANSRFVLLLLVLLRFLLPVTPNSSYSLLGFVPNWNGARIGSPTSRLVEERDENRFATIGGCNGCNACNICNDSVVQLHSPNQETVLDRVLDWEFLGKKTIRPEFVGEEQEMSENVLWENGPPGLQMRTNQDVILNERLSDQIAFQDRLIGQDTVDVERNGGRGEVRGNEQSGQMGIGSMRDSETNRAAERGETVSFFLGLLNLLFLIWIIGFGVFLIRFLHSFWKLQTLIGRSKTEIPNWLDDLLNEVQIETGFRRRIRLLLTNEPIGAASCGIFRATVLLSTSILKEFDREEIRWMLRHELLHQKRLDPITVFGTQIACLIHWMNPIVWILARKLRTERELAVDEAVLRLTPLEDGPDYGRVLLKVVAQFQLNLAIPQLLGVLRKTRMNDKFLERRITMILTPTPRTFARFLLSLSLFGSLAVLGLTGPETTVVQSEQQDRQLEQNDRQAEQQDRAMILNGIIVETTDEKDSLGTSSVIDKESSNEINSATTVPELFPGSDLAGIQYPLVPQEDLTSFNTAVTVSLIDQNGQIIPIRLPIGSTVIRGHCISPDGEYLYLTHQLSRYQMPRTQIQRGWCQSNAISIIHLPNRQYVNTVLLDDVNRGAANPWGCVVTPDGTYLCIALSGTNELLRIDRVPLHQKLDKCQPGPVSAMQDTKELYAEGVRNDLTFLETAMKRRISLERGGPALPRELALQPDGTVRVRYHFGNTFIVVDVSQDEPMLIDYQKTIGVQDAKESKNSEEYAEEYNDPIKLGEKYFNDATLCLENWLSCASCHPDGRTDGLAWDLLNDGLGNPKKTRNLVGVNNRSVFFAEGQLTGPRSNGPNSDNRQKKMSLEDVIRYQFQNQLENKLKDPWNLRTIDDAKVSAIAAYLRSLEPQPSPISLENGSGDIGSGNAHSGNSDLRNGDSEERARRERGVWERRAEKATRGKILFESPQLGCTECHFGPNRTDDQRHDVGSKYYTWDRTSEFYTPALVEVWRNAPYLHSGQYATLRELFIDGKHGLNRVSPPLSEEELDALCEYLQNPMFAQSKRVSQPRLTTGLQRLSESVAQTRSTSRSDQTVDKSNQMSNNKSDNKDRSDSNSDDNNSDSDDDQDKEVNFDLRNARTRKENEY
ncbi:MAG: M56 family metallopeptidase [Thermoguttaceae bacterium]